MSFRDEYHAAGYGAANGGEPLTLEALEQLRGRLRVLDRKLSLLLPPEPDIDEAMSDLDRKCCRLRATAIGLQQHMRARLDAERDGDSGQAVKRRVPTVMKSLSEVGYGVRLLDRAAAAMKADPHTYATFLAHVRQELAAI